VFLIIGVALAALAFAGVLFALNQQKSTANTVSVVVAKTDLAAGTAVSADLVTVAQVPMATVPVDAFQAASQVVSKTTSVAVKANTVLVPAFFAQQGITTSTSGTGAPTVISVESQLIKGFVAVAIPAAPSVPTTLTADQKANFKAELASAAYYILPGDHIDILINNGQPNGDIRYAFQDIPVLRTGVAGSAPNTAASVYLVEVTRSQAELLTALSVGSGHPWVMRYVLRPQAEWGKTAADGSSYSPNYENATGPAVPAPQDAGVTAADFDSIFSK
jgi:Flp pilus assembly protein CpaB